jgi:biopolymer transport protein ExbD
MRAFQLRRPKKKGMRFFLMPLVDVIFLLLTFFMLSSNLAAYSALTLGDYRREAAAAGEQPAPAPTATQPDLVLTVTAGEVRANGAALPLAAFAAEAERLKAGGADSVVVFVRPSATAQDIVSVLEALKRAAFATVSVRTRQGAG